MTILTVGAGQAYATLSAAVSASRDGDIINVQAGTYVNDFATITKDITIKGVGGMANFVATVAPPNGKGIFVTNGDVTIDHLSFSGAAVADMNGAGIRYEGGNLVITDSYFHHNQDGLLANSSPNGTIRIVDTEFAYNGAGDGYSHNIYVNEIASLTIDNSYFHDASIGHQIKSRAQSTTITNSRIYDGTGTGSYSIDLPNGGKGVIRDNEIQQGVNSDNAGIIHYGGESAAYAGSSLVIEGNVVVNDKTGSALMLSNATSVTGTLIGNEVWGLTSSQITNGHENVSGTAFLSTHPSLDTSSPWLDAGVPKTIFGTAGADKLVGTAGADTMAGLAGNDQYVVNHVGDVVVEANGQGTDTVLSSVSYRLGAYVENLTLTGGGAVNGTGNVLANVLTGNSGNNTLDGGGNADKMTGGAGDDTYRVDHAGDVVVEAANGGKDRVYAYVDYVLSGLNVEELRAAGSTAAIDLTGNSQANAIVGNAGNNILDGGRGSDTLWGREGADTFVFRDTLGPSNIDNIRDFSVKDDTIRLENAIFTAVAGTGTLTAAQFVANASGTAADSSDHIIYETDTGKLLYDSNGSAAGGVTQFALLSPGLQLTHQDFFII